MQIKNMMKNKCNQKLERRFFFSWSKAFCGKTFGKQAQNLLFSNLKKKNAYGLVFHTVKPTGRWKKILTNANYVQKEKNYV